MTISANVFQQWTALSEDPANSDLFFLGSLETRITFYSQQVRALHLVHSLHATGRLKENERVAVVGAGAAGLTAALACALLGARVDMIEEATDILPLQSASPRLLHPHIYDWPLPGSLQSNAVLPFLDWAADRGAKVQRDLAAAFRSAITHTPDLGVRLSTRLSGLERADGEWVARLTNGRDTKPQSYDKVILAIGFGDERECGMAPKNDYWRHGGLGSGLVEMTKKCYFVSGSGDGGLTDIMAVLVRDFEHLTFTTEFLKLFRNSALADAVRTAEAAVPTIGGDLGPHFSNHVLPVLRQRGAISWVDRLLRTDRSLVFNTNGPILAKGLAARLNHVMVTAVIEAAKNKGDDLLRFSTGIVNAVSKTHCSYAVGGVTSDGHDVDCKFDLVILRHGPDKARRYQPAKSQFVSYKSHRDALVAKHPELTEPPQLKPETYDFFDALFTTRCVDAASRLGRSADAMRRKQTILLSWDSAYHRAVQQGTLDLIGVAKGIDELSEPVTVMLDLPPHQMPEHSELLLRIARASQGRLRLEANTDVSPAWQDRSSSIASAGRHLTPYLPKPLPEVAELWTALDASLLRMLDARLRNVIEHGKCEELGPVHATISAGFLTTWDSWLKKIDGDGTLRSDFLRLLVRVEQGGIERWDGDHACLPSLTAALVLMLATHIGEPLLPAGCAPGNLHFGDGAIGLGSGCRLINGQPISDFDDADGWNVDALILSGAREQMFAEPDLITDGGDLSTSLQRPRRVTPVVIPATHRWRKLLATDPDGWRAAVLTEFAEWQGRQNAGLKGV